MTRPSQRGEQTKIGFSCSKRRKATERGNLLNFFPSFFLSFFRSFVSPSGVRTALPARSKVSITRPRQGLNQVSFSLSLSPLSLSLSLSSSSSSSFNSLKLMRHIFFLPFQTFLYLLFFFINFNFILLLGFFEDAAQHNQDPRWKLT